MRGKLGTSEMFWNDQIEVYLLAAGRSERMGSSKPLLPFLKGTVLSTMIKAFEDSGLKRIRVIGRGDDPDLAEETNVNNARYIFNLEPELGMHSSILEAVNDCRSQWFCLCPSDMPLLTSKTISECISHLEGNEIVQPVVNGKPKHPVFIKATNAYELRNALNSGKTLRDFLDTKTRQFVARNRETEFQDMDTPADYSRLLEEVGLGMN